MDIFYFAYIDTLYKKKTDKILPQNIARKDKVYSSEEVFWKNKILKKKKKGLKNRIPG